MFNSFGWAGKILAFPLECLLTTLLHYCFSLMHFLFEMFLFFTDREQFNYNLEALENEYA